MLLSHYHIYDQWRLDTRLYKIWYQLSCLTDLSIVGTSLVGGELRGAEGRDDHFQHHCVRGRGLGVIVCGIGSALDNELRNSVKLVICDTLCISITSVEIMRKCVAWTGTRLAGNSNTSVLLSLVCDDVVITQKIGIFSHPDIYIDLHKFDFCVKVSSRVAQKSTARES